MGGRAWPRLLLDNLDDIFVLHGVGQAHPLRAVLGAGALGKEAEGTSDSVLIQAKSGELLLEGVRGVNAGVCSGLSQHQRHHRPQTAGRPRGLITSGS